MKRKGSEKNRHVVAWNNKAEWDQVLEYLYSKDCALQKYALHRISAWKGRYANSTPVAVESTADLVRCQVLDKSGQLDGDDLVLLYGMALVRFVNLMTERQQGRVARPLRLLAGKIKIPEWIVDLRHDFTHRKLPTLNWCRKGCKVVLDWLQQEYWSRQLGSGLNHNWDLHSDGDEEEEEELKRQEDEYIARQKEVETYKRIRDALISFEKEQYQVFDTLPDDVEKSVWPAPSADMSWILAQVKQFASESSEILIDVLMEDGFLVPTVEQLVSLDCEASEDASSTFPQLPPLVLSFWLPLLKMLNSPSFIHLFLEKLFVELHQISREPDSRRSFYISAWISEVILCNTDRSEHQFKTKGQHKPRMKEKIYVNRIQLRWQQLLSACLDAPCFSTPHLLQLILDNMEHPLPLDTRQKLLQLCAIYTQDAHLESNPTPESRGQPIYTLESLHEKLQNSGHQAQPWRSQKDLERSEPLPEHLDADSLAEKTRMLKGSPWQICTDKIPWKNYPLGKVPGQSEDPSCFMVDNYSTMTVFDQPVDLESTTQRHAPGVAAPQGTTDGRWTPSDVNKLKSGLQLF
ncbi:ribosomal biogenesis protein LAS1L [Lampris incognitus]|uniref:ribosomal biogenesis protein LAS1L n=1 Tax=Lampris incognitus TaxID=2546036 RepID=UPI0024B4DFCF|nr:ribosomal biogenesis protein LAS1L [Lampris incognitus]